MNYQLYIIKQRQLEKRKAELANTQVAAEIQPAVIVQRVVQQVVISPEQAQQSGLFGEYGDLQTLYMEIEDHNARRGRTKKDISRETENQISLKKFKPIIESWINAKTIPDRKVFALIAYFASGCADYPLLIQMTDLSIELRIIDFDPTLKRELQAFIADELWELCKKHYWHWPDGNKKNGEKWAQKLLPGWFWQIFERILTEKWPTIVYKKMQLLHIAAFDLEYQGKLQAALNYANQCNELKSETHMSGTSGVSRLIKRLEERLKTTS
jgi:hypothetical protein